MCTWYKLHGCYGGHPEYLGEQVGGAADSVAVPVLDDDMHGVQLGPAVGAVHVEGVGGALDVESVEHEDRGYYFGQSLRIKRIINISKQPVSDILTI